MLEEKDMNATQEFQINKKHEMCFIRNPKNRAISVKFWLKIKRKVRLNAPMQKYKKDLLFKRSEFL